MKLKDIAMLIVSNPRSSAYLQALLKKNLCPSHIIVMEKKQNKLSPGQIPSDVINKLYSKYGPKITSYFDLKVSIKGLINTSGLSYEICPTEDVNSQEIINTVKNRPEKYFIYSGPGGAILKHEILNCGKKFLHAHPGLLPNYRGSTTIYYSILQEEKCYVTVFFLERRIDAGSIIKTKVFSKPFNGEIIDYIYDPYIRSNLLVEVIKDYLKHGKFHTQPQKKAGAETYFIIHPVLKHIAILSRI